MSTSAAARQAEKQKRLWTEYQPRIAEAASRERAEESLFFCELHEERIAGFPAVVLTLERYLLLFHGRCLDPTNTEPVEIRLIRFLWVVSPDFVDDPKKGRAFQNKCKRLDVIKVAEGIQEYLVRMIGGSESESSDKKPVKSKGGGHWISCLVDLIAHEYHWAEKEILKLPLPRAMIYLDRIRERMTGQHKTSSPEADRLRDEFMERMNNG